MTIEQLRGLSAYNTWANTRILDAVSLVSAEEFDRDMGASFGSLRGTLIHVLWGERGWLNFWQVGEFLPKPASNAYPDLDALRNSWEPHIDEYEGYLRKLTQTQLDESRTLDTTAYTLGELIQQSLNHATYHRGQAALLLRQLGAAAPSTDYHDFLAAVRLK